MRSLNKYWYLFGLAVVGMFILGCGDEKSMSGPDNIPAYYVDADGSHRSLKRDSTRNPFPHMMMADGRITLNDRCPVRKAALNRRLPALFVNSQPVGFC